MKSFYRALAGHFAIYFPWRAIWRVKAPRRVSFFLWSAAWGKILTCDNLMRRGFAMAGWCCMCRSVGETRPHLLIHCVMASDLWHLVLRSFGVLGCFQTMLLISSMVGLIVLVSIRPRSGTWSLIV